jgi:transcriptional regulator with XRE-family HTH domain
LMQDTLARKLRVLRAERGLTLREATQRTGVDKDTLSKLERGIRHPHDVTISRLAKGYDVPVEELLEEPALATTPGKAEALETARSEPERPVQDPVHDLYGWVRDETTEDLKRRALEEAQYAKAPVREEWLEERNADREAWLEKGRQRTLAYTTIVAINAELERRGVRSPVELAIKQYNEVMGSADSVAEAGADEASEAG